MSYLIRRPPSITSVSPVIQLASSDTKKATALAISFGVPNLPKGVALSAISLASFEVVEAISVIILPGAMALTLTPNSASSNARVLAKHITAALMHRNVP